MKWKSTVVLLVAAIALGLYLYFVEQKRAGTEESETLAKKVLNLETASITAITIEREDGTLAASKVTEKVDAERSVTCWRLTQPLECRADNNRFEKIVVDLERLERTLAQDIKDPTLEEYGLTTPKATLTFTHSDDQRTTLRVGDEDPLGENVYMLVDDNPDVIVVRKELSDDLLRPSADYRNRSLVELARYDVTELRIIKSGKAVTVKRTEKGWRVVDPIEARANAARVGAVIDKIFEAQIGAFLNDQPKDLKQYALGTPPLVVELASDDGRVDRISLGKPVTDDAVNVYARRGAETSILAVSGKLVDQVSLGLLDLRDRRVISGADREIRGLEFAGEREIEITNEAGQWRITKPKRVLADRDTVNRLLRMLIDMSAEEFPNDDPADLAPYGLDKPRMSVTLVDHLDKKVTILFGKQAPNTDLCYVAEADEKPVYAVPMDYYDSVNQDYLAFRTRRVLYGEGRVPVALEVDREGLYAELRKGETGWRMVKPIRAKADGFHAKEISRLATNLLAVRMVAEAPKDLAVYGLDKPYVRARITTEPAAGGEAETVEILLGAESPEGGRFAAVSGQELVFVVPPTTVGTLEYELRARSIFSAGMDRIAALTVNDLRIEKADDRWTAVKPVRGEVDPYVLNLTLDELADMKAVRFVRYQVKPTELAGFGLDKPVCRVKVELAVGKPVEILLGTEIGDEGRYAMLAGQPFVAVVSPTTAKRLMINPAELIVRRFFEDKRAAPATAPAK